MLSARTILCSHIYLAQEFLLAFFIVSLPTIFRAATTRDSNSGCAHGWPSNGLICNSIPEVVLASIYTTLLDAHTRCCPGVLFYLQ